VILTERLKSLGRLGPRAATGAMTGSSFSISALILIKIPKTIPSTSYYKECICLEGTDLVDRKQHR
jgi:hypothetical protein